MAGPGDAPADAADEVWPAECKRLWRLPLLEELEVSDNRPWSVAFRAPLRYEWLLAGEGKAGAGAASAASSSASGAGSGSAGAAVSTPAAAASLPPIRRLRRLMLQDCAMSLEDADRFAALRKAGVQVTIGATLA